MKVFSTITIFLIFMCNSHAFEGCGEYLLKGKLQKDQQGHFRAKYIVNGGSRAQMTMEFQSENVFYKVFHSLDKPTILKVKILNPFDGTKGVISEVLEVMPRVPKPLSATNEGIEKLTSLNCL